MENSIYKFTNLIYRFTEDPDDLNWADRKLGRNNQSISTFNLVLPAFSREFFRLFEIERKNQTST